MRSIVLRDLPRQGDGGTTTSIDMLSIELPQKLRIPTPHRPSAGQSSLEMAILMRASVPLRTSLHSRTCRLLQNHSAVALKASTIHTFAAPRIPQPESTTSKCSSRPSSPLTKALSQTAAFHTSRRRLILPPEPREHLPPAPLIAGS